MTVSPLRQALCEHLGQTLTPEVAAAIEVTTRQLVPMPDYLDPLTGQFLVANSEPEAVRAWILGVARSLLALPDHLKVEPQIKHTFLDGMYMREMYLPKGTLLVGRIHKQSCMNVVSQGDISILTETGSARVKAGHSAVSLPGTQKVGYAHEDTVFVNVFRTDETNPQDIEDVLAFTPVECLQMLEMSTTRRLI